MLVVDTHAGRWCHDNNNAIVENVRVIISVFWAEINFVGL